MIKLEDIVPKSSKFKLKKTGKEYRLKPITLSDEIWLNEKYGDGLEKVFREIRMAEICKIVFHQMEEEDKLDFGVREVTITNEEGETNKERIGGAKLLLCLVSGHEEKMEIFYALLETVGLSRPIIDELVQQDQKEKKSPIQPTGHQSLTPSPQSTDGQPSTPSPEPQEKSAGE